MRDTLISNAQSEIGTTETPEGSNIVKYNDWYYEGRDAERYKRNPAPYAWCGTFVAYIYHFSNIYLEDNLHRCIGYVPSAQNWLRANNKQTKDPKKGDIVIFDWNRDGFEEHIGIFKEWSGDYAICIEGNTSKAGHQSNGGMVCEKKRHISLIEGFYNVIDES